MKKKLEAELISIAHRILKIKNKSDIASLHQEVQKLYETLSVLRFVENNFDAAKPTIGIDQVRHKIEDDFQNTADEAANVPTEVEQEISAVAEDETSNSENLNTSNDDGDETNDSSAENEEEDLDEKFLVAEVSSEDESADESEVLEEEVSDNDAVIKDESKNEDKDDDEDEVNVEISETETDLVIEEEEIQPEKDAQVSTDNDDSKSVFIPSFELAFDPKTDEELVPNDLIAPQFTFDDLLGKDYSDPVFVKADKVGSESATEEEMVAPVQSKPEVVYEPVADKEKRNFSVNDRLSKGITIGLNDRIAFMKHLFGNSSEDYNRVLSQLLTFDTFEEADTFITDMVKPDYNNWDGKDEYSQRFMEIVERRFS